VCEAQIELTVINKTLLEDIIERPALKAGPRDVAQENWVNSLLNWLCYVFPIMFFFTASLFVHFTILSIHCIK